MVGLEFIFVTHTSCKEAIIVGILLFLPKDIILAAVVIVIASRIKVIIRRGVLRMA